jgi:hypothetical protein
MTTSSTTLSNDSFDCIDGVAAPLKASNTFQQSNIRNIKPLIQPKHNIIGGASIYACTSSIVPSQASVFDDSLSNGKSLNQPATVSMPTIIESVSSERKASPVETKKTAPILELPSDGIFDDNFTFPLTPPSTPLSSFEAFEDDQETCSYAIALYDFESDVPEDLNLKVGYEMCSV